MSGIVERLDRAFDPVLNDVVEGHLRNDSVVDDPL